MKGTKNNTKNNNKVKHKVKFKLDANKSTKVNKNTYRVLVQYQIVCTLVDTEIDNIAKTFEMKKCNQGSQKEINIRILVYKGNISKIKVKRFIKTVKIYLLNWQQMSNLLLRPYMKKIAKKVKLEVKAGHITSSLLSNGTIPWSPKVEILPVDFV